MFRLATTFFTPGEALVISLLGVIALIVWFVLDKKGMIP